MSGEKKIEAQSPAPGESRSGNPVLSTDTIVGQLTIGALNEIVRSAIRQELTGLVTGRPAAHVNSGPTGHANVPGHANFTKAFDPGRAGAHVNSGPTGHANVPGHANFTQPIDPSRGSHVNSGPTGHANVPGHANFTKVALPVERLSALRLTLEDGTVVTLAEGGPSVITVGGTRITRG